MFILLHSSFHIFMLLYMSVRNWILQLIKCYFIKLIAQREVGINATMLFEALAGEIASSHLELKNEGSTTIFYSWEKLCVPHSFPSLQQTNRPHFYFNSSSGTL